MYCGNDYFGYKHIRANHEVDWQKFLDQARSAGWDSESQLVYNWDDLANMSMANSLAFWSYYAETPTTNKGCVVGTMMVWDAKAGRVVMEQNIIVVFATDSDKLITSYPTRANSC